MSELNLDFLDEILDKYEVKGKKKVIKKICIGYMFYVKFMLNKKFVENVMSLFLDLNKWIYCNIKIKIMYDEYELIFLCNDD